MITASITPLGCCGNPANDVLNTPPHPNAASKGQPAKSTPTTPQSPRLDMDEIMRQIRHDRLLRGW